MRARKVDNVLELVGGTPLVRINRMNPNPNVELYVKLESCNPGGSVKDRIGKSMIEAAERAGQLVPGKSVLEASSGNTAIGLAMACAVKGYKLTVTMSESASEERKKILRAYGAEILLTPGHMGTDGAIEEAYRLAREEPDRYLLVDQFNNEANWRAHYENTGPEIWEATEGKVTVVCFTLGTSGTVMGTSRYFRDHHPAVRVVGVEPYKGHKIQGLKNMKESYPPGIFDPSLPHAIVNIEDEPAYEAARRLAREEGIFVGMSAGAAMMAGMDEAARLEKGVVVALLPDTGERYLSTSLFVFKEAPVPLRFHNTLTRSVDPFKPNRPGKVGIYSCGPSLDGFADLGLCRRMVFADLLRRHLAARGLEVRHVLNLGDMDDRTITECIKQGAKLKDFTAAWEREFVQDMAQLGVLPADAYPRASDHVNDMVAQARALLEKGVAYEKLRSVYFSIRKHAGYGKMSRIDLARAQVDRGTVYDYYEKENPQDFTLIKRSTLAELKAGIYWSTPWGSARPGWHVECSTMATRYLGQPFDIHTASTDLVFPHGDNEIAIAEAVTGKPLANCWMHCEVVMAEGRKVSRATDNAITLRDALAAGFDAAAVRYWLLSTHYRTVLRYSTDELARAAAEVRRLNEFVARLRFMPAGERCPDLDQWLFEARQKWNEAMDNDLNVPMALGALFAFVRKVNGLVGKGKLDPDQNARVLDYVRSVDAVLSVVSHEPECGDAQVDALVAARDEARKRKDYAAADAARDQLASLGVQIIDTPAGTRWRRGA